MKLSITEWPYLALGSVFAGIAGVFPVGFAVIISEIIKARISFLVVCNRIF